MGKDKLHVWLVSKLAAIACPENAIKITISDDVIIVGNTKAPREKCFRYPDGCEECWWSSIENLAFTGKFDGTVTGVCGTCGCEIDGSYDYEDNRLQGNILVPASDVAEVRMLGWRAIAKALVSRLKKRWTVEVPEHCPADLSKDTKKGAENCCQKTWLKAVGKSDGCREDENRRADCWIAWAASDREIKLTEAGIEPADEDIEKLCASWEALATALARHMIDSKNSDGFCHDICPSSKTVATDCCQKERLGEGLRLFYELYLGKERGREEFAAADDDCKYDWDSDLLTCCWIFQAAADSGVEMKLADWAQERLSNKRECSQCSLRSNKKQRE